MSRRLDHRDYTAGWVCPLEVEQIAALHMFDERHMRLPQLSTDHNVYNLGTINGHNVVIAGLPQAGNNSAATVVAQLRMSFPNVRFLLLVGIGGGVPARTDDRMLRLGDVVVSKPTGTHSGVIQYDHGKAWVGRFERTGSLAPPPAVLLNAAQDLAVARAMGSEDPLEQNMKRIDSTKRKLRHFAHPGIAQDLLFLPGYTHLQHGIPCDKCNCDLSQTVTRTSADDDLIPTITVHRGTIASGEMVVKDAILRDELAADGLICFEMEAAGALIDFPCMVIRGISDYCDSHKNDVWHGYAAAAAASYARQLFAHIPMDKLHSYVSMDTPLVMETIGNGFQDMSSQMSSLILDINKLRRQISSSHTRGHIFANDDHSLGKLVRAYVKQAVQDCKTVSSDEMMGYIDSISMDVSAEAQEHALFGAKNQSAKNESQDENNFQAVKDARPVATNGTGAKNQKPRFVRHFRIQKRFYSKVAMVNIRLSQLRQTWMVVPDTMLYFSVEVDIIPRVLTRWGLSISFSNIPNQGGYYSICPCIRPIRVFAPHDPIWTILQNDDAETLRSEYINGRVSARDCDIWGNNLFRHTLWNPTLRCYRFVLECSNISTATLFESAEFFYTEDFLEVDIFGMGYSGTGFAVTELALKTIKESECEPEGHRGNMIIWYNAWEEARKYGLSPIADEPKSWVDRIAALGIDFIPFSWPLVGPDADYTLAEFMYYNRWLLELCLANGGNPNSELGFEVECVPLEFALNLAADIRESQEDGVSCHDLAHSLLCPLINAGADVYYIREQNGEMRSISDLAFDLGLGHCWQIAVSNCGLDFATVVEEDDQNLLLYRRDEPAAVTGIDFESIKPVQSGLRRRGI